MWALSIRIPHFAIEYTPFWTNSAVRNEDNLWKVYVMEVCTPSRRVL